MRKAGCFGFLALALILAGCGEREIILTGPRSEPRELLAGAVLDPTGKPFDVQAPGAGLALPGQVNLSSWTHRGGNAQHLPVHARLGTALQLAWAAPIGKGDERKYRISADPVAADGRIFAMDSRATVTAVSAAGATLWSRDLTPARDRADDASGGGMALGEGKLFVTTGFGEVVALDPASGDEIWRQSVDTPLAAAPTVAGGLVFVVARDSSAWAIETGTGRVHWRQTAAMSDSGISGSGSPVVGDRTVIVPYPSNQIAALFRDGGLQIWSAFVGGKRTGRAYAGISDISGDPVLSGGTVYVGNATGRVAAIDAATGDRRWTAAHGAQGPMTPAGGALFFVTDENRLARIDTATGATVWTAELPYYTKSKIKRRNEIFAHHGPVLAGGRIILASNDGLLRAFDPASGELLATVDMPDGATTNPIVVDGTLYVVSDAGELLAFR